MPLFFPFFNLENLAYDVIHKKRNIEGERGILIIIDDSIVIRNNNYYSSGEKP